jgi:hypothetical protein
MYFLERKGGRGANMDQITIKMQTLKVVVSLTLTCKGIWRQVFIYQGRGGGEEVNQQEG